MKRSFMVFLSVVLFLTSCNNQRKNEETTSSTPIPVTPIKPIVNVYLENSGSMFGYISTGNDFDRSISSLLTNIIVSGYSDSINLFYINNRTFRQNVDISTFIRRTNLHNSQTWLGNLGRTDMCALLDTVISTVNDSSISVFVSDCIFSPGKNVDASRFIGTEKDCITLNTNNKLKTKNLAFVVFRLISQFKGNYYDCHDNYQYINSERPYFIWIIGEKENIKLYKRKITNERIEGQLQDSYTIFKSEDKPSYAVQMNPKIGKFSRFNSSTVTNTQKDRNSGKFMFSVAVDFSSLLVNDLYLTTPKNYKINNPNYSIEIIKKQMGENTHLIKVSTKATIISPTKLTIQLLNIIPNWIGDFSDDTCADINDLGMMQKTYGLKHIVQGIYAAYNYEDDKLFEISININQTH